jgi:hypothetical protein
MGGALTSQSIERHTSQNKARSSELCSPCEALQCYRDPPSVLCACKPSIFRSRKIRLRGPSASYAPRDDTHFAQLLVNYDAIYPSPRTARDDNAARRACHPEPRRRRGTSRSIERHTSQNKARSSELCSPCEASRRASNTTARSSALPRSTGRLCACSLRFFRSRKIRLRGPSASYAPRDDTHCAQLLVNCDAHLPQPPNSAG